MPGYISEIDLYGGPPNEFIELAIPTGTDTSAYTVVLYRSDGTIRQTLNLGTASGVQQGNDIYILDNADGLLDINNGNAIAMVDDTGTVLQFLSFNNAPVTATTGPANGLTSTNMGTMAANTSFQSDDGGASYYVQSTPNKGTIPCYAPDTMIDTPAGPREIRLLGPGDLVITLDNGPQPIVWAQSRTQVFTADDPADARPVLISAGALGPDRPAHDLVVSPQHRVLVGDNGQLTRHFDRAQFAPAKALTGLPGIRHMMGKRDMTWVHVATAAHHILCANGCFAESLLLGPMVIDGLTPRQRNTVKRLFGPAPTAALPARPCLAVGPTRRQLAQPAPVLV